jgi:hypothetical protein
VSLDTSLYLEAEYAFTKRFCAARPREAGGRGALPVEGAGAGEQGCQLSGLLFGSEYLAHGRDQRFRSERLLK